MTAAAYGGSDSLARRWWIRFGHYYAQVNVITMPVIFAGPSTVAVFTQQRAAQWAMAVVVTVAVVVNVASEVALQWHDRSLCLLDGERTPLDPQAEIGRYRRRLRVRHQPRLLMAASLVLLGWAVASSLVLWGTPLPVRLTVLASAVVVTASMTWLAVLSPATHNRLRPWCPGCHWDDGGEEEPSPEPAPDPAGVVTR